MTPEETQKEQRKQLKDRRLLVGVIVGCVYFLTAGVIVIGLLGASMKPIAQPEDQHWVVAFQIVLFPGSLAASPAFFRGPVFLVIILQSALWGYLASKLVRK